MHTKTFRGVAAGAGAAALILAGATAASATVVEPDDPPGGGPDIGMEAELERNAGVPAYENATCDVQPVTGNQTSIQLSPSWAGILDPGEEFLLLGVRDADVTLYYPMPQYSTEYPGAGKNVTHMGYCWGTVVDDENGDNGDNGDENGNGKDNDKNNGDNDAAPSGPPVETDGPSSREANTGLLGGLALLLGGAGTAGWALRRRASER